MHKITEHNHQSILVALIIAGGLVGGAIAYAQGETGDVIDNGATAGITFPVVPLGNCGTKEECHAYCEESAHIDQCIAFAKEHGLMNKKEVERSEKFSQRLKERKTPGGCTSPLSCRAYCEDITHLSQCIAFAETEGFKGEEYTRGKKLNDYLKQGGTMPGGCTSRRSCETYCSDFAHAEECYRFAEAAGVADEQVHETLGRDDNGPKISPEHLKRLAELSQRGETPGGCTTKEECVTYCSQAGHMEECVTFGEKVGFMKKEEVERARTFMKKGGPGGCTSQEACHAFCNDPVNQEMCFKFAEENGLMPPEELAQIKEGWVRMRQGLENAPSEVKECVTSTLGGTIIEDIQSGKLVPGPDIGDRVRDCFEKFGAHHDPQKIFVDAPEGVKVCLKEKLGDEYGAISSGKTTPTPEIADTFRVCFQQVEFERQGWGKGGMEGRPEGGGNVTGPTPAMLEQFLRSAPPEIAVCLKEKLGERFEQIRRGELTPGRELGEVMHSCFEQFGIERGGMQGMVPPPGAGGTGINGIRPMPPQEGTMPPRTVSPQEQMLNFMSQFPRGTEACLKEKLGEEGFVKVSTTGRTPELEMVIRACVEQLHLQGGTLQPQPAPLTPEDGMIQSAGWTSRLPLPVQECLKRKFGERYAQLGYQAPTLDVETVVRACYTEVSGGNIQVAPTTPMPADGMLLPPPETPKLESNRKTIRQQLLGAVLVPFVALWNMFR